MRRDSRLSVALHVLLHISEQGRATSDELGSQMGTNPVVLRRLLSGLRDAGIVGARKGHGGGWLIARDLAEVTVADVYEALGAPGLFSIGPRVDSPGCPIEKAVDRAIERALGEAEALVLAELRSLSVADLAKTRRRKS